MSKRKLLLADDSITIQKVVNLTFADEGIEVISVGDGDSAMQKFDEFMPDLAMVDVNMPGLTGYEICQIIKQNEDTRHIPVILLVGSFEPFDEAEANRVGADDFLTKPFQSIRQLVNKVNDLLSRSERITEEPPSIEVAPPNDSFADTLAFESKPEVPTEFGDAGMDDEMIETSQANNFVSEPDLDLQPEATADYAKTQPLSTEDLKGFPIFAPNEEVAPESAPSSQETEPETVEETFVEAETTSQIAEPETVVEEPETSEDVLTESKIETEAVSEPEIDYYAPITEESEIAKVETSESQIAEKETTESVTPEISESENFETETTDLVDQTEATDATDETETANLSDTETPSADESEDKVSEESEIFAADESETEETEESESDSALVETQIPIPENSHVLSFDEGDLLELPPPLVEETGIRPQVRQIISEPEAQSEVSVPEVAETETEVAETETEVTPSQDVAAADPLQSFPPELIELIAQKVAERISDKAIRDIAWEVVPQMTELILKKMAEDKLKE